MNDLQIITNEVQTGESEKKQYYIQNYDALKETCINYINDNSVFAKGKLEDELDLKRCKEERANLNKQRDQVKYTRLHLNKDILEVFNNQCKELEGLLEEAAQKHSDLIDEYSGKKKANFTILTIESLDEKSIDALRAFVEKHPKLSIKKIEKKEKYVC